MVVETSWAKGCLHVVGQKYAEFAGRHAQVVTKPLFERALDGEAFIGTESGLIVLGQGIPVHERVRLLARFERSALAGSARLDSGMINPVLASRRTTHKVHERNILITEPILRSEDGGYASDLVVDEACAELDDHVTGQHVSAAVLAEAARQLCTATIHGNLIPRDLADGSAFLIDRLVARFSCYVLPVPARLHCKVLESSSNQRSRSSRFSIRVECLQGGEVATSFEAGVAVFERNFISSIENEIAERVCGFNRNGVAG